MSRMVRGCLIAASAAVLLSALPGSAEATWPRRVTSFYSFPTAPVAVANYAPVGPVAVPYTAGYAGAYPYAVASPVVAAPVVVPTVAPIARRRLYYAPYVPTVVAPAVAEPVTNFYAPAPAVAAPVTTYYGPTTTTYSAPVTTFPAPPAAPVTTNYAPALPLAPAPVGGY